MNAFARTLMPQARLSDRIMFALDLALEQKDTTTAEHLLRALDLSTTRQSGELGFTERRDMSPEIEAARKRLSFLKKNQG